MDEHPNQGSHPLKRFLKNMPSNGPGGGVLYPSQAGSISYPVTWVCLCFAGLLTCSISPRNTLPSCKNEEIALHDTIDSSNVGSVGPWCMAQRFLSCATHAVKSAIR
ncbi:hypothetical protein CISG_04036 [Coccidioides immitis RMSCC 3703]|uniref:Uncharacterized protein n=3 Tax=Coccidioides TaxID=5500 RepID=A0A0J8TK76_COCIT|nr:hypothetical protein CIRG_08634 [Coccidioides immitis RMSCC 2394]KMU74107.1 hypothetical protein CISG_04036 [Coccidioides immitis RMSCC 3703]